LISVSGGTVEQHDVFNETVEFGLPGTLKKFMRSRDVNPDGRRITMDNISATEKFLSANGIDHQVIDLTVGASS
jgi:hypothetical protein